MTMTECKKKGLLKPNRQGLTGAKLAVNDGESRPKGLSLTDDFAEVTSEGVSSMYKVNEKSENPNFNLSQPKKGFSRQMVTYQSIIQRGGDPVWLRQKIFCFAQTHSLSQTAKQFGCHINTVKKIKKRGNLASLRVVPELGKINLTPFQRLSLRRFCLFEKTKAWGL